MSITVLNYMDQALVDRIHSQAAKRAETAKQTTSDDFATVLADSTKAIENNQNTISTNTAVSDTSTVSTGQTAASSASSYTSNELDSIFEDAANTYGVSSIILKSIAKAESGFNPSAVSSAGAVGIMQLMPSTAAALGVSNSYDARENIMGGAKYISQLVQMLTNTAASRLLLRHRITLKRFSLIWKNLVLLFLIRYLPFQTSFLLFSV